MPSVCFAHSLFHMFAWHILSAMFAARTPCASQNNVDISSQIYITKRILACIPSLNDLLQKEKNVLFRFSTMTHITHTQSTASHFQKTIGKQKATRYIFLFLQRLLCLCPVSLGLPFQNTSNSLPFPDFFRVLCCVSRKNKKY